MKTVKVKLEAFWALAQALEMNRMMSRMLISDAYAVEPDSDNGGEWVEGYWETSVYLKDKFGEKYRVDERGELFWALAHLYCKIVPNAECRSAFQSRFDALGRELY